MVAIAVACAALPGCGATSTADRVIVRVGRHSIVLAAIDHQLAVLAPGRSSQSIRRDPALKRRALESLIASRWVIGEAVDRGVAPAAQAIERRLAAKEASAFPGGDAELSAFLKASGQSMSDLRRTAEIDLARAALRSIALKGVRYPGKAEVESYYRTHRRRYALPPRRQIWITNRKSAAAIERLKRKVARARSFAPFSQPETVPQTPRALAARGAVGRAIFATRPNVLVGPLKHRVDYYAFEVKRVLPATHTPLAHLEASIQRRLDTEARRRALATFLARWRAKWRAKTDCRSAYVVPGCRQYGGPVEDQSLFELR
jgi:hypothetical protein